MHVYISWLFYNYKPSFKSMHKRLFWNGIEQSKVKAAIKCLHSLSAKYKTFVGDTWSPANTNINCKPA